MQEIKPIQIQIHQGEIIVNEGYEEDCQLKVLYVDLHSKYADCFSAGMNPDAIPEVTLFADEERPTLNIDENNRGKPTCISFPEYKGWEAYNAWVGRYTLTVILRKLNATN